MPVIGKSGRPPIPTRPTSSNGGVRSVTAPIHIHGAVLNGKGFCFSLFFFLKPHFVRFEKKNFLIRKLKVSLFFF